MEIEKIDYSGDEEKFYSFQCTECGEQYTDNAHPCPKCGCLDYNSIYDK